MAIFRGTKKKCTPRPRYVNQAAGVASLAEFRPSWLTGVNSWSVAGPDAKYTSALVPSFFGKV